jgi:hexosaminidase
MLDVSRHFHPKEFIKSVIDDLAMHKMNTFHWHLCDDQGWRIEIKKYPRLTEVGAWRVDREDKHWILREAQKEGEKAAYGGFYTQEDIKEIVAYARSRFVMIVPEIEMPGHCLAALAAYPEYSCSGGPFTVPPGSVWPIKDVYCPGKDETFAFLESILAEVIDLFPGEYIHIGGDEVDKSTWKACPKCQARIAGEGLKNEEELQSYFIRRIEMFLNSRNKKLIGWDEILEGGLAPNAAVMSWRGTEGGIAAARQGHDVVMTPTSHCYFDYYQGEPQYEPLAIGGYLPLSRVYSYEPTPEELTADEAAHILGAQANLWTEYVPSPSHARYMMFPRLAALSELAWSAKERKNWEDFAARLNLQFRRYEMAKMNYARSAFAVAASPSLEKERKELTLALQTEIPVPAIRFTLDGSDPSPAAKLYKKPLRLKKTTTVKAAAFDNGQRLGMSARFQFNAHQALGKPVELKFPYKEEYSGSGPLTLTDGLRGSVSQRDGRWQGFEQDDFQALIDLGKPRKVDQITAGFLQNIVAWIFLPASIEIAVSRDGQDYKVIASWQNEVDLTKAEPAIKNFSGDARGAQVRFIRVEAKNIGTCPPSHPAAGGKAWLFVDEIIVD